MAYFVKLTTGRWINLDMISEVDMTSEMVKESDGEWRPDFSTDEVEQLDHRIELYMRKTEDIMYNLGHER